MIRGAASTRLLVTPPPPLPTTRLQSATTTTTRSMSSSSSSFSPLKWWRDRQQNKEAAKYKERIADMANKPQWTIQDMKAELDEVVSSWTAKIPGINNNKETAMAKKLHAVCMGLIRVIGPDATDERIQAMTRTEKLKAAAAGATTVQEMNQLIQQFGTTALMHKILRNRVLSGKSLPETPEATQALMQTQGRNFLSAAQKQKMIKAQAQNLMRQGRRR